MNRYETKRYWLFAFKKHSQGPDNGFKEYLLDVVDTRNCFFLYTFSIRTCNFVRGYVLQGTAVMRRYKHRLAAHVRLLLCLIERYLVVIFLNCLY